MQINVITIFPEMILSAFSEGVVGRAQTKGLWKLNVIHLRDFTTDAHQTVDDRPYGGGDGMIMMTAPLEKALLSLKQDNHLGHVVYLSPQGQLWGNNKAQNYCEDFKASCITFICGRYGGIDQRLINEYVDEEISIGDYVLSGGEVAAIAVIDSMLRFLPGVLGNADSPYVESLGNGLLEAPQFTRPAEYNGVKVPDILMSGHHERIQKWRHFMGLLVTAKKRPELLNADHVLELKKQMSALKEMSLVELESCGFDKEDLQKIESLLAE